MRDRFAAIYTAVFADILDARGHHDQTLPPAIRPLEPGTRVAGPAYTMKGGPATNADSASYDTAIRKVLAMLGAVPEGCVALYACDHDVSAHIGELSVTSPSSATRASRSSPASSRPRIRPGAGELEATQVPVTIGRARIEPGDWIVGDDDGVVVVPHAIAEDVLTDAAQKAATESEIRVASSGGMPPLEAYEPYGTF